MDVERRLALRAHVADRADRRRLRQRGAEPDYCDAESGGMHVWVNLGKDTATVYATGPEAPPYDVPSTIAPDRLSVTTIVPARPFLPKLSPDLPGEGAAGPHEGQRLRERSARGSRVLRRALAAGTRRSDAPRRAPCGSRSAPWRWTRRSRKRGRVAPGRVVGLRSRCTPPAGAQTRPLLGPGAHPRAARLPRDHALRPADLPGRPQDDPHGPVRRHRPRAVVAPAPRRPPSLAILSRCSWP